MSTVNKEEIQKFSKLADEWWDVNGKFKPLHTFNPIRIEYIKEKCIFHFELNNLKDKPLSSIKVLDIGCGGGLVSEPMYRLGAEVTGLDASLKNINVAKLENILQFSRHLFKSPFLFDPQDTKLKFPTI